MNKQLSSAIFKLKGSDAFDNLMLGLNNEYLR